MRGVINFFLGILFTCIFAYGQVNVVGFDFEDEDQVVDFGLDVNSAMSITENDGASVSFPAGNNPTSGESFSTNNWESGEYIVFQVSTVGLTNLNLEIDLNSSSTGPRDFKLAYSTSGIAGSFTDIVGANFQSSTSFGSNPMFSFVLPGALENQADLAIRIECTSNTSAGGGTIGSTGTFRLDNIKLYSDNYTFVINEFLADPDAATGDANNDGIISTSDDEFIEFINTSSYPVEISNWTIHDATGLSYTFDYYSEIPNGESVVVFAGGTPTGIPGTVFTAGSGWNALNNTGDDITLYDRFGNVMDSHSYGSEGGDDQSIARNPDITGPFVKHSTIDGSGNVDFSPGKRNDDGSALPIELTSFTANYNQNTNLVKLNWETATETNNAGFEVHRSLLNDQFNEGEFEVLDFVHGNGTVNSPRNYEYTDINLPNAENLWYRLKQIDNDGAFAYSKVRSVEVSAVTSVDDDELNYEFSLKQNYPNPFNPTTNITFSLPGVNGNEIATLKIYNLLGQEVATLVNEAKPAGAYEVMFNASELHSGVYFYTLNYGEFTQTRKLILIK